MSATGRPEREYRSAQHEGGPLSATGRPEREYRSAQHEGGPLSATGRPEREYLRSQHEGGPLSATGRPEREYLRSQHEGRSLSTTARLAKGLLPKLLYAAILVAIWQAGIVLLELKEFLVPSPLAVFKALFDPATASQYQWWTHIGTTLGEILAAFVFTALFGFVLALLITWSDLVRGIAMPVIAVFNSLPKIALAPLVPHLVRLRLHRQRHDRHPRRVLPRRPQHHDRAR